MRRDGSNKLGCVCVCKAKVGKCRIEVEKEVLIRVVE